ncbi:uncharacterized protein BDZ99DRAFT_288440 [Mytilinidion resinicola]|uniref:Uncharacterized protein n=1 Tax=Mytilinidion resinicola TaxID=574789 RepID=A0A6A6YS69_9PEZI|nr:uncharacterized protein BDZ99DRAFT_288440 [Mytilinidion resinicola]KAF2810757.1 hypothetical protein BDZ99DRAFT_288440 [Mytilinidion resinicola]
MRSLITKLILIASFSCGRLLVNAQSTDDGGYIGYSLTQRGDNDDVLYETANTNANVSTLDPEPDVYLNATVHVGEIDITVSNLTAKINLDAQVLSLLKLNAGVIAHIDRVFLQIQNVSAKVSLEARLGNLVLMINDILSSLDLNPILATVGNDVGSIVNTTVGGLTTPSNTLKERSYNLEHNILYAVNDYSGHTHTNRVLAQNGDIVTESLDDNGELSRVTVTGHYLSDMTFNGYNESTTADGKAARRLEYVYVPFNGLSVVSEVFVDESGAVLRTQVLSEASGGGSSSIGGQE